MELTSCQVPFHLGQTRFRAGNRNSERCDKHKFHTFIQYILYCSHHQQVFCSSGDTLCLQRYAVPQRYVILLRRKQNSWLTHEKSRFANKCVQSEYPISWAMVIIQRKAYNLNMANKDSLKRLLQAVKVNLSF